MPQVHRGPRVVATCRVSPKLHALLAKRARLDRMSMNDVMITALTEYLGHDTDELYRANIAIRDDDGVVVGTI